MTTFVTLLIVASLLYYAARWVKHKRSGATAIDAARAVAAEESPAGQHSEKRARNDAAWERVYAERAAVRERAASQPTPRERADLVRARIESGMTRDESLAEDRRLYGRQ